MVLPSSEETTVGALHKVGQLVLGIPDGRACIAHIPTTLEVICPPRGGMKFAKKFYLYLILFNISKLLKKGHIDVLESVLLQVFH